MEIVLLFFMLQFQRIDKLVTHYVTQKAKHTKQSTFGTLIKGI